MTQKQIRVTSRMGYRHKFSLHFLLPQYWGIWCGVIGLAFLAFIPVTWRDKLATVIGQAVSKYAKKQRRRADINLRYCFPHWNDEKRSETIQKMFITVSQILLSLGEIAFRSPAYLYKRCEFIGLEHIQQAKQQGKNVILLVPHTWSIDFVGVAIHNLLKVDMVGFYNPHRNQLVDWLWNSLRERFGGKMHPRQNGIKSFIEDIKMGNLGYFLPDEDYGEKLSVYTDFFATQKATLPILHKIARIADATIIPMFPIYNSSQKLYQAEILPPITLTGEDQQSAREMNKIIEYFVKKNPEQYVWILRILKTQPNGKDIYQ